MAKTKTVDMSAEVKEVKEEKKPRKGAGSDALLESLKEELGIKEEAIVKKVSEVGKVSQVSKGEKSGTRDTSKPRDTSIKSKPRSKKYLEAAEKYNKSEKYALEEAVSLAQTVSYAKFGGTIEAHINTNSKNIRGLVNLPHSAGRSLKVLAFGKGAAESGADLIGTEEILTQIEKGKIGKGTELDFDVLVTTPEWMGKLAKSAKVLGPKGLMPNPKNGIITDNLSKAVAELQAGKIEYKTEANGKVIHLSVGKVNQPKEEIAANIKALFMIIGKSKIKKITLAPTMGPGVLINLSSI